MFVLIAIVHYSNSFFGVNCKLDYYIMIVEQLDSVSLTKISYMLMMPNYTASPIGLPLIIFSMLLSKYSS